jgi:mannose/fructose/N-acetylgalactosamine-specific phosphotransferase system component IIC
MLEMVQALWRPVTGFVMSGVVLAIALGWLPPGAEEHATSILATAGAVLSALTASRAVQRVQEVKAQAAPMGVLLQGLSMVKPVDGAAVEEVKQQLRQMQEELARIGPAARR